MPVVESGTVRASAHGTLGQAVVQIVFDLPFVWWEFIEIFGWTWPLFLLWLWGGARGGHGRDEVGGEVRGKGMTLR